MSKSLVLGALAGAALAGTAAAHVVLSPGEAPAGGYYAGALRVTHGCAGSATVALRVVIPGAVISAKPQPKPGWSLSLERETLSPPIASEGGGLQRERVTAITWRGRLADDAFDTFGLAIKAPAATGPLYFPTMQTCEAGETRWTDIPAPGQAWHAVPHPAPMLTVTPGGPLAGMTHQH